LTKPPGRAGGFGRSGAGAGVWFCPAMSYVIARWRPQVRIGMLAAIRQLFDRLMDDGNAVNMGEEDVRLAVAALLYHVVAVDGVVSPAEQAMLGDLLEKRFGLDPQSTRSLIKAAETADEEAVDLYHFTSLLKQRLDDGDRERIIEMMWRLVFADGGMHEFEENVVWRVAELLSVPSRVRVRLKQVVRNEAG